ncbi:ATP-binding cassette domain-containing protein [Nocardiopsis coralliicola]
MTGLECTGVVRRPATGRGRRRVTALDGVDFAVAPGESVAVVGRSGSGKTTLVGVLALLDRPQHGRIAVTGADGGSTDVWAMPERRRRELRRRVGWIPQDPLAAFDPRYTVGEVVAEALPGSGRPGARAGGAATAALLARVGLDPAAAGRWPASLSGGERRRVAVARALAADPDVLLADEPTAGLDVLAQDEVLGVLDGAMQGRTRVVVTHDLRIARRMADRIVVLDEGRVAADLPAATPDGDARAASPALALLIDATP